MIGIASQNVWLRAFYGFDPENAGYIGFTRESTREHMMGQMRDGDLVLIYGAVEDTTRKDLRAQALGFLEVALEKCFDIDRASQESLAWKSENGFADRWNFGLKVRRAWRIKNRVAIKSIAPLALDNHNRFERTTRAILLEPSELNRALSHPVWQVNVFGEPAIAEAELASGQMADVLKPSRGFSFTSGQRTSNFEDGENELYLMVFSAGADFILGKDSDYAGQSLIKVGRSNDPIRRVNELNAGFPQNAIAKWKLRQRQKFSDGKMAADLEERLKQKFSQDFKSQGNEFYTGNLAKIEQEFVRFCVDNMPRILGAADKARGI